MTMQASDHSFDTCSAFGSMLLQAQDPLTVGCTVPAVMGKCVLRQTFNDETTLTLEDETGYAVINVMKCDPNDLTGIANHDGLLIIVGKFKMIPTDLGHAIVVSASSDFDSIRVLKATEETVAKRSLRFKSTKLSEYQYSDPLLDSHDCEKEVSAVEDAVVENETADLPDSDSRVSIDTGSISVATPSTDA